MPRSFDGLFHLYRLLQLDHLLRQGVAYSPWAPDLLFGYGYPIFDFVPPLPYYLAEVLHVAGLSLTDTILFAFTVTLLASGVAMYFFVRDIFGAKAAVLSAVAYMYAPFFLYDILFRGHLPGALATLLYPLVLWSYRRLINEGGLPYFVASSLLYAACFLTHNPATLIFSPFLLLYVLVLVWLREQDRRTAAIRAAAAVLIGAGLAAFFWLPALWDRQWIQIDRMITPPDLDYHTHFVSLSELLSPSPAADTGLMNPGLRNNIGPVFVLLSLLGAATLWRTRLLDQLTHIAISALGLAVVVFMLLPQSAVVWENLPLLKYLAYPHRFLRLGSLMVALLCGAAASGFTDNRRTFSPSFLVAVSSVAMIVISTFSLLYPPYYRDLPGNPSFTHMMEFERRTGTIGTTSFGEYLPLWVQWIPSSSPLETAYRSSATIERLDHASLAPGTQILDARYGPTSMRLRVDAPQSFRATFTCLYFPGWRAYVDGVKVSIAPTPGQGLISVPVPAGEHLIQLRFEDTPVHVFSKAITGLSVTLLVLLSLRLALKPPGARVGTSAVLKRGTPYSREHKNGQVNARQTLVLGCVAAALLTIKVGYLDGHDTYFKTDFDGRHVKGVHTPLDVNFADQITLLGYDLSPSNPHPGDAVKLDLYWKARQPLTVDYSAFAHVVDDELNIYAQKDSLNPGRYPTSYWELDEYDKDTHEIVIPPGTPPGEYAVAVGLYDPLTSVRLPIIDAGGDEGGMLTLQQITVVESDQPADIDALGIRSPMRVDFENGMTLLGYSAEREYLAPRDFYRVAIFWKARRPLDESYRVVLRLLDQEGKVALSESSEPSAARYPTTEWEQGELVRDNRSLWIRGDFPPGRYILQLAILSSQGEKVLAEDGAQPVLAQGWLGLVIVSTQD